MNKLQVWGADNIDPAAIVQAERTSRLPIVERVALMPDAHVGIGATVGSVVATRGAIIPAAVGVDIGCGMAAVRFDVTADLLPDSVESLMGPIAKAIPAGVGQGHQGGHMVEAGRWWDAHFNKFSTPIEAKLREKAIEQFGSLGSGNHFVEVCLDEEQRVWIVLHSGSRGLGNILGTQHIKRASELAKEAGVVLEDKDLAYLTEGSDTFAMYVADMLTCQDYARGNRALMLDRAVRAFTKWLADKTHVTAHVTEDVNCHHNFAQKETHDGHEVWVTRKGAIQAQDGQLGIIPGSMGTRSYIVRGKGNPASLQSCSHGAGRRLSRGQAKREHTPEQLAELMAGKVWNSNNAKALVDEIPHAYKDIDTVMDAQRDLVEPVHELHQILNYKGQ